MLKKFYVINARNHYTEVYHFPAASKEDPRYKEHDKLGNCPPPSTRKKKRETNKYTSTHVTSSVMNEVEPKITTVDITYKTIQK
jgi:hypothetical protein